MEQVLLQVNNIETKFVEKLSLIEAALKAMAMVGQEVLSPQPGSNQRKADTQYNIETRREKLAVAMKVRQSVTNMATHNLPSSREKKSTSKSTSKRKGPANQHINYPTGCNTEPGPEVLVEYLRRDHGLVPKKPPKKPDQILGHTVWPCYSFDMLR